MPKHDIYSPKAIANRIKAKGLQKLKWYCQMCQKQCRDENGFKCHKMSESHQRQMRLFISNPTKFMSDFSRRFEHDFLQILKLKGGRRIKANDVYTDYIKDRHHLHMNSTCWSSLSGFVQYLGRTGKAKIDNTEKGWYIQYIERDPTILERQKSKKDLIEYDEKEAKYHENKLRKLLLKRQKLNKNKKDEKAIEPVKEEDLKKDVTFSMDKINDNKKKVTNKTLDLFKEINNNNTSQNSKKRKLSELEKIKEEIESRKRRKLNNNESMEYRNGKKYNKNNNLLLESFWIKKDIILKVNKGSYNGIKGIVKDIIIEKDNNNRLKYYIILKNVKNSKDLIKVNSNKLETVIPSLNRKVKILNGKYTNIIGILNEINIKKGFGYIKLLNDKNKIVKIPFDDFSKLYVDK